MSPSTAQNRPALRRCVSSADLFSTSLRGPSHVVGDERTLAIEGTMVARVSGDTSRLNPLSATSAEGMPAVDILAALAVQNPSGVLLIELPRGQGGFAFEVRKGRLTGGLGPGPAGKLALWCTATYERQPGRFTSPPPSRYDEQCEKVWIDVARDFVREHAVEFLEASATPGTRMTLLRGDVQWIGASLPVDHGLSLQHLLLEQARRHDELPTLLKRLGDVQQLVVPLCEPCEHPPGGKPSSTGREDDWGLDEPDAATNELWNSARGLFRLCDGGTTIEGLAVRSMLGRFRTYEALSQLAQSNCVVFVDGPPQNARADPLPVASIEPTIEQPQPDGPRRRRAMAIPARPTGPSKRMTELSPANRSTGYSLTATSTKACLEPTRKTAEVLASQRSNTGARIPRREQIETHGHIKTFTPASQLPPPPPQHEPRASPPSPSPPGPGGTASSYEAPTHHTSPGDDPSQLATVQDMPPVEEPPPMEKKLAEVMEQALEQANAPPATSKDESSKRWIPITCATAVAGVIIGASAWILV